jgi:murein DD-endopeptidase MepM/ murein hydrolase activator NlpD
MPIELEWYGTVLHGPTADKAPSIGPMPLAWKRVLERWDPDMFPGTLGDLDDAYNLRTVHATKIAQRAWGLYPSGKLTKATFERSQKAIRGGGTDHPHKPTESAWDARAIALWKKGKPRIPPARCFPLLAGEIVRSIGGVAGHMARPLGNWQSDNAIDIMCSAGDVVVAPKPGYVSKGGGHDPHGGPVGTIFGEHCTIECDDGTAVFMTHIDRIVSVGERVLAGELIGRVGDWPRSSSMDHVHVGARGFNPETMASWPKVKVAYSD